MIRAALSARASVATPTSEAASKAAVAVQKKVLGMAHDSGRPRTHRAGHHGPLANWRNRSTKAPCIEPVRPLCRIDRSGHSTSSYSKDLRAHKTDDSFARLWHDLWTRVRLFVYKEHPCESLSQPLPASPSLSSRYLHRRTRNHPTRS